MHFVIAALVLIALVYWLWPIILACFVAGIALMLANQAAKRRNLEATKAALPELIERYKGKYALQASDPLKCIRIDDILIRTGKESDLALAFTSIHWDASQPDAYQYKFIDSQSTRSLILISGKKANGEFAASSLSNRVEEYFRYASISALDSETLDSRLCSLLFLNLPEAQWASHAISEINNALQPLATTYEASKRNELLAGNKEYLLRAIGQLQREADALSEYSTEACEAMVKIYEFLSVPKALMNFEALDIKPLAVFSKKQEMREEFKSAIAIKKEYDELRIGRPAPLRPE